MTNQPINKEDTIELTETDLEQPSNVVRLAYSGDGPKAGNWLLARVPGEIFLARHKTTSVNLAAAKDFSLGQFLMLGVSKEGKGVRLAVGTYPRQEEIWVDPYKFCAQMDYVETIAHQQFMEIQNDGD